MSGKTIQCPCGYTLQGGTDEAVIRAAQEHAREVHDMELSREQALSMARPD